MECLGKPPVTRVNRAFIAALLIILVFFTTGPNNINRPPPSVTAVHLFPFAKFYLTFQNRLSSPSDVLKLDCSKSVTSGWFNKTRALDTQWIKQNQDWGFSFRTNLREVSYDCVFTCLGLTNEFLAFLDDPKFQDYECGGRHCTWMFNNDGLFLYHDKDKKYNLQISFKPGA